MQPVPIIQYGVSQPRKRLADSSERIEYLAAKNKHLTNRLKEVENQCEHQNSTISTLRNSMSSKDQEMFKLKEKINYFDELYNMPVAAKQVVNEQDKQLVYEYMDFANSFIQMPQSNHVKSKVIDKKVQRIIHYVELSRSLYRKCKHNSNTSLDFVFFPLLVLFPIVLNFLILFPNFIP